MSLGSINELCLCHWNGIAAKLKGSSPDTYLDGRNLDLATVIATARYLKPFPSLAYPEIDSHVDMENRSSSQTAV